MGLCAVADLVIAESATTFGFTETRLGIIPAVISPYVVAKIGESHARALFPSGTRFDARRALAIGLVHDVVDGIDGLDAAIDGALEELLRSGPEATRAAKALVREIRGLPPDAAAAHTTGRIAAIRVGPEAQEGLQAFIARRSPAWVDDRGGQR
jgi:methylglutaconyl-CoA hydratase